MPWLDKIERLPGWLKSLAILAMIAALGYADYLSGFEISFSIFYLAPVVTAAWILGRRAATLFAVLSATSWLWADIYSGHMYSHPIIPAWNAIMRMGVFLIVSYSQITAKRLLQRERQMARLDYLTGIMNPRGFYEIAQRTIDNCQDMQQPFSLVFMDMDNFKDVNDTAGHEAGDKLLENSAQTIRKCIRATDVLARLGGDEFGLLLPGADKDQTSQILENIRKRLLEMTTEDQPVKVTFSMGAVICRGKCDLQQAIKRADNVMYGVKKSGKDRIEIEIEHV
jgi:diguanylate cyclase (GGDEF)-like protein